MPKRPNAELVYNAAQQFLDRCVRQDLSLIWPTQTVWTVDHLRRIKSNFVDTPLHGGNFETKISQQFGPLPSECWQVLADGLYVYCLPSMFLTARKKYATIAALVGARVPNLPAKDDEVWRAFGQGILRTGQRYHFKYAQLRLIFMFALEAKGARTDLENGSQVQELLDRLVREAPPGEGGKDMRNALLHMLFPDDYESIISDADKQEILQAYDRLIPPDALALDVDARIRALRPHFEKEHGEGFDFYQLRDEWRHLGDEKEEQTGERADGQPLARYWVEKTLVAGKPDREAGPDSLGRALWSPQQSKNGRDIYRNMRLVKSGDVVFHFLDNKEVAGVSLVAGPVDDKFICPAGTEWSGRPGYRIPLADYQRLDPSIDRAEFLGAEEWKQRLTRLLSKHRNLFFNAELNLNQGNYLTEAPSGLVALWQEIYRKKSGRDLPHVNLELDATVILPRAWIFQANPGIYDIDRAVRSLSDIEWTVRKHRADVHRGDRIYIWRSGQDGGIVALGSLLNEPATGPPRPEETPYYRRPDSFSESEPRVLVKIERVLDPVIRRVDLLEDPGLKDLAILKFPSGTNFPVTPEQAKRLAALTGESMADHGRFAGGATVREPFTVASIKTRAEQRGLQLGDEIYASLYAALESGKHVILTGPPGTGKTTLAHAAADAAVAAGRATGFTPTTATADWTTYETIGGLKPSAGGTDLAFAEGHFLEAIRRNRWLVIDELNRSNFDRAFGQLFTVLSGQPVQLPYERTAGSGRIVLVPDGATAPLGSEATDVVRISRDWRIIATINVFDKTLLFEMSFALMRRFAFVEVAAPGDEVFKALISKAASPDTVAADMASRFLAVREQKDIGPAIFLDLARFLRQRRELGGDDDGRAAFEAFYGFLLPQFEGIDDKTAHALFRTVRSIVGSSYAEQLRATLKTVLDIEIEKRERDDEDEDTLREDESEGTGRPVGWRERE